jgi:hypothetical protein
MRDLCRLIWYALIGLFLPRAALEAEILVLRHQLNVLRRKSPKRLAFGNVDRLVFTVLYRAAPELLDALRILKPQTVIRWHRAGLRAYWRWKSRPCGGRPKLGRSPHRKSSQISPIFIGDSVTLQVSREKDGKLRFVYVDGTIRRSFSRTAAGKLRRGVEGWILPPGRASGDPPPLKTRTPLRPPPFFRYRCAAYVRRTVHFSPSFLRSRYT